MASSRFAAESGSRNAAQQEHFLLRARAPQPGEPARIVVGHGCGEPGRRPAQKVSALLDDGRTHVGSRPHVSQRDVAAHHPRERAGGAERPERLTGEIHTHKDPDPAARHVWDPTPSRSGMMWPNHAADSFSAHPI